MRHAHVQQVEEGRGGAAGLEIEVCRESAACVSAVDGPPPIACSPDILEMHVLVLGLLKHPRLHIHRVSIFPEWGEGGEAIASR